jgi:hypothetical protein
LPSSPSAQSDGADALAARITALERLEDALAAFARLRDADGAHAAARLAWNAALPFLQKRPHGFRDFGNLSMSSSARSTASKSAAPTATAGTAAAMRALSAAACALAAVASPLGRLRAALHLELACFEAARGRAAKALQEAEAGLAADPASSAVQGSPAPAAASKRPIARHLEPLARSLRARTGLGAAGSNDDDEAVVALLERARGAQTKAAASDYLDK